MEQRYDINISIGKRIIELRRQKGMSLERLAYENDIPKSTISRIEQGIVDARISNLERIARGLDVRLSELFR